MVRTPKMLALTAAFAATVLNVGAMSPAVAGTTARVSYKDLDLGTSAGQNQLAQRLHRAATQVCAGLGQNQLDQTMACRSEAVNRARADLAAITLGSASPTVLR